MSARAEERADVSLLLSSRPSRNLAVPFLQSRHAFKMADDVRQVSLMRPPAPPGMSTNTRRRRRSSSNSSLSRWKPRGNSRPSAPSSAPRSATRSSPPSPSARSSNSRATLGRRPCTAASVACTPLTFPLSLSILDPAHPTQRSSVRRFVQESRNNVENTLREKMKDASEQATVLEKKAKVRFRRSLSPPLFEHGPSLNTPFLQYLESEILKAQRYVCSSAARSLSRERTDY